VVADSARENLRDPPRCQDPGDAARPRAPSLLAIPPRLRRGYIRWSFREHIERSLRDGSGRICIYQPFLEFGLYVEQIGRYRESFGERLWISFHQDFQARPVPVFQDICRFLGVSADFVPDMSRLHFEAQAPRHPSVAWLKRSGLWRAAAQITPRELRPRLRCVLVHAPGTVRMNPADRAFLIDYYREDIRELAILTDRNLDAWLHVPSA
jgi:hypothetical protein